MRMPSAAAKKNPDRGNDSMAQTYNFRKIRADDRERYFAMCRDFYSGDAVLHPVPEEYFAAAFDELMRSDTYLVCYIFESSADGAAPETVGYALLARTFSQEAGGAVVWLDELYVVPEHRSEGIGHRFFDYMRDHIVPRVSRVRLEVDDKNPRARMLYEREGFSPFGYDQMVIECP